MTTPQSILHNIEYKVNSLVRLLEGHNGDEESHDISEILKGVEIEVSEFNERLELIEDKMNIIIRLLGRDEKVV